MRLLLKFSGEDFVPFSKISKHAIQGMFYSHLIETDYADLHTKKGFKFFTFSDIFPSTDFYPHSIKTIILSSPDEHLIQAFYSSFKKEKYFYLSNLVFKTVEIKKLKIPLRNSFESGSPIVLYENNRKNRYLSFKRKDSLDFFLNRLKENAVKKFNSYYNDEWDSDGYIFDKLVFKKEVAVNVKKQKNAFTIIGSVWSVLEKSYIEKDDRKFYMFLMECGLGEKNSLGFGLVNPRK